MRLHVPPRDIASFVILRSITRAGWATAGVLSLATAVIVIDVMASKGTPQAAVAPVGFITAQLAALLLMFLRPRPRTAVLFIVVSVICIVGYQLSLLTAMPGVGDVSPFLLNRPIVVVCAIGAVTGTTLGGIRWSTAAFLLGETASVTILLTLGHPVQVGLGPVLAYSLVVTIMLWLQVSRNSQVKRVPDPRTVDAETRRLDQERDAEARAAAVIHDTVLSDLAAIVHGRIVLPDYDRQHLGDNVDRLRAAMAGAREPDASGSVDIDLLEVVSDLQWRGLTVELSGTSSALALLSPTTRSAALNAIRAALDNVLAHAQTTSADLFIDEGPDEIMIMVVDQGTGFDTDVVTHDRLGLRLSIVKRVEDSGGRASLWSEPGVGTSVVISLPKAGGAGRGTD